MDFEKDILDDLHRYLISQGRADAILPDCPDLEEKWPSVAAAYLPDGMREFNDYPLCSLGWIMYVGIGLARLWDADWTSHSALGGDSLYALFREPRGFDSLDDHVLEDVLGLDSASREKTAGIVGECAARTLAALRRSGIEPGTPQAAQAYFGALHALYTSGIALGLNHLGYHMTPLGNP